MQLMRYHLRFNRVQYILISHLHGDHFFGLPGLLSTMGHLGRKNPLFLFGPPALEKFLELVWEMNNYNLGFEVIFRPTQAKNATWIIEEKKFRVKSFPLEHRIPTTGFFFEELSPPRRINNDGCKALNIPYSFYTSLQEGEDYTSPEGITYSNRELTLDPHKPRSYTYCSDTLFSPELVKQFANTTLLYHESTFLSDLNQRALETGHSTAEQAAQIAKMANAGALLLGHFSSRYRDLHPLLDEAKGIFTNTQLAKEGETYSIERTISARSAPSL